MEYIPKKNPYRVFSLILAWFYQVSPPPAEIRRSEELINRPARHRTAIVPGSDSPIKPVLWPAAKAALRGCECSTGYADISNNENPRKGGYVVG